MIKYDAGSVTGSNLRKMMLCEGLHSVDLLHPSMEQQQYQDIPFGCEDKVWLVEELLLVKHGEYHVPGFDDNITDHMLADICKN